MLLRFGCSNHRSIKDYQEISFVASALKDEMADLCQVDGMREPVLSTLAIYGANASGKSNVLKALNFFVHGIEVSHSGEEIGKGIRRKFFRLDKSYKDKPSRFDCDFVLENARYHYGFVIDSERVLEEWLFAYPRKQRQVWFHRKAEESDEYYFGKSLRGKNRTIASLTRANSLFLSSAAQNNHEQLTAIFHFFTHQFSFNLDMDERITPVEFERYLRDDNERQWLIDFLRYADVGITDAKIEIGSPDGSKKELHDDLVALVVKHVRAADADSDVDEDSLRDVLRKEIYMGHAGSAGESVYLPIADESDGTKKLIHILGIVFEALNAGQVLVIDELDTSMHPLLSRRLVELFQSRRSNKSCGQLLFTTHDTNLLCGGTLRRDQVWFTEKSPEGATVVFPLTDIRTRKTDNIEKGYLQGRYGAIPFLGGIDALMEDRGS